MTMQTFAITLAAVVLGSKLSAIATPVSYTHLDVYKRQAFY